MYCSGNNETLKDILAICGNNDIAIEETIAIFKPNFLSIRIKNRIMKIDVNMLLNKLACKYKSS